MPPRVNLSTCLARPAEGSWQRPRRQLEAVRQPLPLRGRLDGVGADRHRGGQRICPIFCTHWSKSLDSAYCFVLLYVYKSKTRA
jgi:hypothetical protein